MNKPAKKKGNKERREPQDKSQSLASIASEERSDSDGNDGKNKDSQYRAQIIVAIIGLVGVLLAALISKLPITLQSAENTPTETVVTLTNTTAMSTAISVTDTPIPLTVTPLGYYDDFDQNESLLSVRTPVPTEEITDRTDSGYITDGVYHWEIQAYEGNDIFTIPINFSFR